MSCNKYLHIVIFNEAQKELINNYILYRNYNIRVIDNDNYITLNKVNEKILIDIISMLNLKIEIIKDNIRNEKTTRTIEGGPYLRKYLKITTENGMEILTDSSPTRLVYDPLHPDAKKDGVNIGYLVLTNVDLIMEYYDLIETIQLYNSIVDYIKINYKKIAIEKINIMRIDEIEHNISVKKSLGLLLEFSLQNNIRNDNK
jgi:flagellar basal-body rod protein FlgC